jgi:hypothetical protein
MRTPALALAGLLAVPLFLVGCSAPATVTPSVAPSATASADAGQTQSKAEACQALAVTMNAASETLNSAIEKMGSDPEKAVAGLRSFATTLKSAVGTVTNPEVKAQGEKAVAATEAMAEALAAAIKDPNQLAASTAAFEKFQKEVSAIATVCGG